MTLALLLSLMIFTSAAVAVEDCDCEVQRPINLAVVNGVPVLTADVEADAQATVGPIRKLMEQARSRALENLIRKSLIDQAARARNLTPTEYLQTQVYSRIAEPTEEELRRFYETNRTEIKGTYEESRERILQYFRQQRQDVELTLLVTELRYSGDVKVLVPVPEPPRAPKDLETVLATVNKQEIRQGEVEMALRSAFYELRRNIYQVELEALNDRIDRILVNQEAVRRNISADALIKAEVVPKVRKVDAFDVAKFYNENRARFTGRTLAEVKEELTGFLQDRELAKAIHEFALGLRKTATVTIGLVEPAPPSFEVAVPDRAVKGNPAATVTIVEFSDFQCPKCATLFTGIEELLTSHGDRVRVIFRHYPLEQHAMAYRAALAAEAARAQGKFWEYATLLFANQTSLTEAKLLEFASQVGLDRARFEASLARKDSALLVESDLDAGARVGVRGTPAVFVNGQPVADNSPAGVKAAVEAALARPR